MNNASLRRRSLGIVVGVNGSSASRVALHWAARNATRRNLPLTIVCVAPAPTNPLTTRRRVYAQLELPHQRVRRILDDAVNIIDDSTRHGDLPQLLTKVAVTDPVTALADLSHDAEMVVVGSPRRGVLRGALCCSISSTLVRRSHCPVAAVRDKDPRMPHPGHGPVQVRVSGW
ncbi:MAG: universal stress protein [Mycobacterium sp.]